MKRKTAQRNTGLSLVEIIVYMGLLSLLMLGIFSTISSPIYDRPLYTDEDYQLLIENYHE